MTTNDPNYYIGTWISVTDKGVRELIDIHPIEDDYGINTWDVDANNQRTEWINFAQITLEQMEFVLETNAKKGWTFTKIGDAAHLPGRTVHVPRAEYEKLIRDAERYAFLRDHADADFGAHAAEEKMDSWGNWRTPQLMGEELDKSVDESIDIWKQTLQSEQTQDVEVEDERQV